MNRISPGRRRVVVGVLNNYYFERESVRKKRRGRPERDTARFWPRFGVLPPGNAAPLPQPRTHIRAPRRRRNPKAPLGLFVSPVPRASFPFFRYCFSTAPCFVDAREVLRGFRGK